MSAKHLLNLLGDHLHTLPIVVLYLTDGCNSRCVTCDIWRNPRRNMKPEIIEALANDVKPLAVRWVVLSGGEAMQLVRFDLDTRRTTVLTDGRSLNGTPVWSHRSNLIAFESTRRGGHGGADRDLWVMDPKDPASARLVSEVTGRWSVADWSPDDTELLAVNLPAENTDTSLWRVNVKSGERRRLSPAGGPAVWRAPVYSPHS